jgi:hypothetical protein
MCLRKPAFAAAALAAAVLAISACTPAQREDAAAAQALFARGCSIAMASPWARPWVATVCQTEAALAGYVLSPDVLAWIGDIADRVKRG